MDWRPWDNYHIGSCSSTIWWKENPRTCEGLGKGIRDFKKATEDSNIKEDIKDIASEFNDLKSNVDKINPKKSLKSDNFLKPKKRAANNVNDNYLKDLTTGKEGKRILNFALPMLFGNIFQQLYNVVDAIIVGKVLGDQALAAVRCQFPLYFCSYFICSRNCLLVQL